MHRHLLAAALSLAFALPARAAPPAAFTYSGFLTTPAGAPVTAATDLTFRFYDAAAGGAQVGASEVVTVTPGADGYFAAVVGGGVSGFAGLFSGPVWMTIQIQGDAAEMAPRIPITSVPSALAVDWSGLTNRPAACAAGTSLRGYDAAGAAICDPTGPGGTVTAVSVSAPLQVSNPTTTPSLSIAQAGAATSGFLASSDWNAFTGKQARVTGSCLAGSSIRAIAADGTVTCQADSNSGGTITAMGGVSPITATVSGTTATISAAQAGAATSGFLASADWNAFNAKQARVNSACAAGSSIRIIDAAGLVTCQPDTNSGGTVTSVTAGAGLTGGTITGTGTIALDTSHANTWTADQTFNGQVGMGLEYPTSQSTAGAPSSCTELGTCYPLDATAPCSAGKHVLGGGCYVWPNGLTQHGRVVLEHSAPNGNTGWGCMASSSVAGSTITAYAICARMQ